MAGWAAKACGWGGAAGASNVTACRLAVARGVAARGVGEAAVLLGKEAGKPCRRVGKEGEAAAVTLLVLLLLLM